MKPGAKIASATVIALATGSFLFLSNTKSKPIEIPSYSVSRVIDGDTFVTSENQHIRISSTEAPELDQCGGLEAKKTLEKLILNKPIYLKVLFLDPYKRLVSQVYTPDAFINEKMLENGYSYYYRRSSEESDVLKIAGASARSKKKGIFGNRCTQTVNIADPPCNIKGNIRTGKFYILPSCGAYYEQTQVQLYLGDRWFCSESEAIRAGF